MICGSASRVMVLVIAGLLGTSACDYKATPDPVGSENVIGRVSLGGDSVTVAIGETVTLQAYVYDVRGTPMDVTRLPSTISWASSDVRIATVADGLVRGVGPGRAIISASVGGFLGAARVGVIPKTP